MHPLKGSYVYILNEILHIRIPLSFWYHIQLWSNALSTWITMVGKSLPIMMFQGPPLSGMAESHKFQFVQDAQNLPGPTVPGFILICHWPILLIFRYSPWCAEFGDFIGYTWKSRRVQWSSVNSDTASAYFDDVTITDPLLHLHVHALRVT